MLASSQINSFRSTFLAGLLPVCWAGLAVTGGEPPVKDAATESPYLRFVPQGRDAGRLEAGVVTFEKKDLRVHLVAAVHIADRAYYRDLNRLFEGYDAL